MYHFQIVSNNGALRSILNHCISIMWASVVLGCAAVTSVVRAAHVTQPSGKKSEIIGPALNFTLEWEINGPSMDCCFSAENQDAQHYIAIGFSGPKVPSQGMTNSDIVWAFSSSTGTGTLQSVYSNTSAGQPIGTPTLKISSTSFELKDGTMTACFSRLLKDGHNPIANGQAVIWANGPLDSTTGMPTYHGADAHDPTGKTQTHRSDEVPAMQWS
eukprot:m.67996 g.67996  ORF g.67996 m.67996 type:complete len:215 (+) comp15976_c0_seq1:123-767(+)